MSMQRITVTIPDYIYADLTKLIPVRGISSFVTKALEKELLSNGGDPIKDFIKFRNKLPRRKGNDILKAINKGRV